jgi:type II secretory pathway component PulJ
MRKHLNDEAGVTLIEAMIALCVLTVGAIGLASAFLNGINIANSGPNELVATQKAAEAVESVFSARDSKAVTWAQLKNVPQGGIFVVGDQPLKVAGTDGIVNTADDLSAPVESVRLPGPDQMLETADDVISTLNGYKREIRITDVANNTNLRVITVIITYPSGTRTEKYTLTAYISAFA